MRSANHVDYFDSFGDPPPANIRKFLFAHFKRVDYNSWCLQEVLSIACGAFTIYFLHWHSMSTSFERIMVKLRAMSDDDAHVTRWLNRKFKTNFTVFDSH
jgi:hypothetical protein